MKQKTARLAFCGLFAALSAALSPLSISIGPIPIGFVHISLFLSAGLLGKKYGTVSQLVFVMLGVVGIPVFSGFHGGIGVLAGPTGGFIVGYIGCVFVTALLIERFGTSLKALFPAMYAGWVVTYALGLPWYMFVMNVDSVGAALSACVLPFLPGDLIKTVLCAFLIKRLRPALGQRLDFAG